MPDMVQSPGSTRQLVFAVVVCLAVPLGVGVWLDNTVTTFPAAVLGGMAVGVVASTTLVVRRITRAIDALGGAAAPGAGATVNGKEDQA